jgi:hypothetical protein
VHRRMLTARCTEFGPSAGEAGFRTIVAGALHTFLSVAVCDRTIGRRNLC